MPVSAPVPAPSAAHALAAAPGRYCAFDPEADPARDAKAIVKELKKYDAALYRKPRWLVLNKIDLVPEEERKKRIAALLKGYGKVERHFVISAIDGAGCREVVYAVMDYLEQVKRDENPDSPE